MKKSFFITLFIIMICAGCAEENDYTATIAPNHDSGYVNTFKELNIGVLNDFDFRLLNADKRWVRVWVEHYKDGEKASHPVTELSYGLSPNQREEGPLGFGMINPNTENPLFFLYAPGISQSPKTSVMGFEGEGIRSWDYAIGEGRTELQLGETHLLGVYRQSASNSMRNYNLQDQSEVEKMINEDQTVLLLKIKIEKRKQ